MENLLETWLEPLAAAPFSVAVLKDSLKDAAEDVRPYLQDVSELDIWSRDFFHQMIRKIVFA